MRMRNQHPPDAYARIENNCAKRDPKNRLAGDFRAYQQQRQHNQYRKNYEIEQYIIV